MANLLPRRRRRRITPVRWPQGGLLQFPLGLDTLHTGGDVPLGALRIATNIDLDLRGAVRRRQGRVEYGTPLSNPSSGDYELIRKDGTAYLMRVVEGELYVSDDDAETWSKIPIRLYSPYPAVPDDDTVGERFEGEPLHGSKMRSDGTAGQYLAGNRTYQYAALAVKGDGKTPLGKPTRIKTPSTVRPIDLVFHASYGAETYEIWRRHSTDNGKTWGDWGLIASGLTHVTREGKTLVRHTDDGQVDPDTSEPPPEENTTEHTLPLDVEPDWETLLWVDDPPDDSSDHEPDEEDPDPPDEEWVDEAELRKENAAYIATGDGLVRCDGERAEIVKPTDPGTYLETAAGVNALGDFRWPGHRASACIRHHAYWFVAQAPQAPIDFFWSRADDPCHFSQLARIQVPRAKGGKILDFAIKDDALVVGVTTGMWVLHGTVFSPTGPSTNVHFAQINDVGPISQHSIAKAPNGWVIYLARDKTFRAVVSVAGTADDVSTIELAPLIHPTITSMTDHENAAAVVEDEQYWCVFPADGKMIRLYLFEPEGLDGLSTAQTARVAAVLDTQRPFLRFLKRHNGDLLAADRDTGGMWKLKEGYTDDGTVIPVEIVTHALDFGDSWLTKHVTYMMAVVEQPRVRHANPVIGMSSDRGVTQVLPTLVMRDGYDIADYDQGVYDPFAIRILHTDLDMEGRWFELSITESTALEPVTLIGVAFQAVYTDEGI